MGDKRVSRRAFLSGAGGAAGWAWAVSQWPALAAAGEAAGQARDAGGGFEHLEPADAADLEAVAARIIPSDDGTPGAREAGVVWFIDRALGGFFAAGARSLLSGLASLNEVVASGHGDGARFAVLQPAEQDRLLAGLEGGPFFQAVRYLTVAGMFAMPEHGGNRGHAGWRLIGFDHRHSWKPPFGRYDREPGDADTGQDAEREAGHGHP